MFWRKCKDSHKEWNNDYWVKPVIAERRRSTRGGSLLRSDGAGERAGSLEDIDYPGIHMTGYQPGNWMRNAGSPNEFGGSWDWAPDFNTTILPLQSERAP